MVSVDCLDESFLEEKATDWQDLTRSRWIAAEHCSMSPVVLWPVAAAKSLSHAF